MTKSTQLKNVFANGENGYRKTYVIAEIGINHEGNVERCADMIRDFVAAGADAIKLQTVNADRSYAPDTESYRVFSTASLSQSETEKMFLLTRECGAEPFTTVGDMQTLFWVDKIHPSAHKISSGLLTCLPLVAEVCKLAKPVIMSTGMSDSLSIDKSVEIAKKNYCQLALLQCTSEYPCSEKNLNLAAIDSLSQRHGVPTGFSDHSIGVWASPLAVAAGARIVEKHVTFDKKRTGFDHQISLEKDEFLRMVEAIRRVEIALGKNEKFIDSATQEIARHYERRLAAARNLRAGHVLSLDDFLFMRFSQNVDSIAAQNTETVLGRKLNQDISKGQPITWQHLI